MCASHQIFSKKCTIYQILPLQKSCGRSANPVSILKVIRKPLNFTRVELTIAQYGPTLFSFLFCAKKKNNRAFFFGV